MRAMIITGYSNVLRAPKDVDPKIHGAIGDLHIAQGHTESGLPCMRSVWLPTPQELALLSAGCPVMLEILGSVDRTGHPPVAVKVGSITDLQIRVITNENKQ